jgi:ArsR family transcriptional regulator, arsenate/arsenite/antimonite-responsive transcriptional repressor
MTQKLSDEQQSRIFAALSDPTRLKAIEILAKCGEMSGIEMAQKLGISLALFCHHSKILVEAGLIQKRKQGLVKYHSLNRQVLEDCVRRLEMSIAPDTKE